MPMRQRLSGATSVMSVPANSTRPESGATVPLAMPNSVLLPAPFGPMMPRASPSPSARWMPSATTTAPKRLEIFSKLRTGGMRLSLQPPRLPYRAEVQSAKGHVLPVHAETPEHLAPHLAPRDQSP